MIDVDDSVLEEREYQKGFSDGKMKTYQQGSDFAEEMGVKFGTQLGKIYAFSMVLESYHDAFTDSCMKLRREIDKFQSTPPDSDKFEVLLMGIRTSFKQLVVKTKSSIAKLRKSESGSDIEELKVLAADMTSLQLEIEANNPFGKQQAVSF